MLDEMREFHWQGEQQRLGIQDLCGGVACPGPCPDPAEWGLIDTWADRPRVLLPEPEPPLSTWERVLLALALTCAGGMICWGRGWLAQPWREW